MGLLCCQDLLCSGLQDSGGRRLTCCCCCCCGSLRAGIPVTLERFLNASLDALQKEAETAIAACLPGVATHRTCTPPRSPHGSLRDCYPLLVNSDTSWRSVCAGHTMTSLEESRVLSTLLLSPRRAAELVAEVIELGELRSKTPSSQLDSSKSHQSQQQRFAIWHDVYQLINCALNDIAVCNLLHLLSRTNIVKFSLRRRFSGWVDRFLFGLLRRVLSVRTPVTVYRPIHSTPPPSEKPSALSESSPVCGKLSSLSPGCSQASCLNQATGECQLVRLCLTYFVGLLFRVWASMCYILDEPNPFFEANRRRHERSTCEDIKICCFCCCCGTDHDRTRIDCRYHGAGKGAVLGNILNTFFPKASVAFPLPASGSVEDQPPVFGMRSLLLPGLLMLWRDPRFPFIFPAEYAQSFDSLVHFLHRHELQLLRRQQHEATRRSLGVTVSQRHASSSSGGLWNDPGRGGALHEKWQTPEARSKALAMLALLLSGETLLQGRLESLQQLFKGGFEGSTGELSAGGCMRRQTKDEEPMSGFFLETLAREYATISGDAVVDTIDRAAKVLAHYHASLFLRSLGPSRLPRQLGSDVATHIGQHLASSLLKEHEASRLYSRAREAATDFVASVCRWLWGSDVKTKSRSSSGGAASSPDKKGVDWSDTAVPGTDNEDDCGVWLWQFGSAVNGFCMASSDVDVCVLLKGEETPETEEEEELNRQRSTSLFSESGSGLKQKEEDTKRRMLSWHRHETEFSSAERAVRLLGEIVDGIRLAQNVEEDILEELETGLGTWGGKMSTAAARLYAERKSHEESHQPCLKVVGVEPISRARVPICRIEFLCGVWSEPFSSSSSESLRQGLTSAASTACTSFSLQPSESNALPSSDSESDTCLSTALESSGSVASSTAARHAGVSPDSVCLGLAASGTPGSWSWQVVKVEVSFGNRLAILNTRYISCLAAQKPVGFALAATVKLWASRRGIANAYKGYLSSYTWLLLAFHFLACREKPVIQNLLRPPPAMLHWANMEKPAVDFWNGLDNCWFFDPWVPRADVPGSRIMETLSRNVWRSKQHRRTSPSATSLSLEFPSSNSNSFYPGTGTVDPEASIREAIAADGGAGLAELLYEFFRFYAYEFNPYLHVVSLRYNSPPASPFSRGELETMSREAERACVEGNASMTRHAELATQDVQLEVPRCAGTDAPKGCGSVTGHMCSHFSSGFSGLREGAYLRKLDLSFWVSDPGVPVHEHQWDSLGLSPQAPTSAQAGVSEAAKKTELLEQITGSGLPDSCLALRTLAYEAGVVSGGGEIEYPHVAQQRRWLQERKRVTDSHRALFQDKYKKVGRKKDIVQYDTLVVEDPFRELDLLEPKFEKQDRLFYELKRATHLLAAAARKPLLLSYKEPLQGIQARTAVHDLFRPFDATAEKDMLRELSDIGRFAGQKMGCSSNVDACRAYLEELVRL